MTQTAVIRLHRRRTDHDEATVTLVIDGQTVTARAGDSVLQAAVAAGIYIPALCSHPDLPAVGQDVGAAGGCGLCQVEVTAADTGLEGLQRACQMKVAAGLRVATRTTALQAVRQAALARLLADHPHVCLTCPQRDGCSRVMCCFNNTVEERCCSIMSHCELRKVADYIIIPAATPVYDPQANRLPVVKDEPLYDRDYNLCIDCRRCLVACNEVRGVGCLEVKNTNGRSWVGPVADTLLDSGCKFCNACVEVCPTGALLDRTRAPAQAQAAVAPCTTACPAGIDVPRYVQLAGLGRFAEANAVVREKLPFPAILGRVCHAPCESDCRRGHLDDPLSIRSLKRIAAEHDDGAWRRLQRQDAANGRRVAVVGAGLAGLTVAWYLSGKGYAVTVFEAAAEAGGMARYGIPAFRLPREVLDAEIAEVAARGVEFRFHTRVEELDALFASGFKAVFLGIGAPQGAGLEIPGADLPGVVSGVDFLRQAQAGEDMAPLRGHTAPRISIIGGGDVACDAARVARRLTAGEVELVYRRSRADMPAQPAEVAACLAEGVTLREYCAPLEIMQAEAVSGHGPENEQGRASSRHGPENEQWCASSRHGPENKQWCGSSRHGPENEQGCASSGHGLAVSWAPLQLGRSDARGRRHLEMLRGDAILAGVEALVVATGQRVQVPSGFGLLCDEAAGDGRLRVREDTLLTSRPGVFAGGDAVLGPASLIEAVAQGRQAAAAIDQFLGGDGQIDETLLDELAGAWQTDPWLGPDAAFNRQPGRAVGQLPLAQRRGWDEVELGYGVTDAQAEGSRCLKCNLACTLEGPQLPPTHWFALEAVAVHATPTEPGVLTIHDRDKQVRMIRGVPSLRNALVELLAARPDPDPDGPWFFVYELAHFYSQRESQLLQDYSAQYGGFPPGLAGDELDALF
jgi:NADPH-dependent glutamate synthase beta subunit-like oxidoreductase/formate hydrogenlyase subunit 6/NADH:ubiquinone oxidoreductase subunit I